MTPELSILLRLYHETLKEMDPALLIEKHLQRSGSRLTIQGESIDLNRFRRIHLLGAGKAAPFLWEGLQRIVPEVMGGMIVSLPEHRFEHDRVRFLPGSHPVPDVSSLAAGEAIIAYTYREIEPDDLVLFLITGGASALMVSPEAGVTLTEKQEINSRLLRCGAAISEINTVRKRISRLKGGKLARLLYPATVRTLILSDIADSPLTDIGSGPTIVQKVDMNQARQILIDYNLWNDLSEPIRRFFSQLSPPPANPAGIELSNRPVLLGDLSLALETAFRLSSTSISSRAIIPGADAGDVADGARQYASFIRALAAGTGFVKIPGLLIGGGEWTVKVQGSGKGGRNQEFLLRLLQELDRFPHPYTIISVGTDGIDGPTDAAGAWIDHQTMARARHLGLEPNRFLSTNDSYHFFHRLGQLIFTGPTRHNLADIRFVHVGSSAIQET